MSAVVYIYQSQNSTFFSFFHYGVKDLTLNALCAT